MANAVTTPSVTYAVPALITEDDIQQHIEDTPMYSAIRGGKLVEVTWSELDESEKRQAYITLFNPCAW